MQVGLPTRKVLRFGAFELDLAARRLSKRGRWIKLQDLPFRLLIALLEQPGAVMSHEELRTRLWGETAVEVDEGLHTAVRKLRAVLGDSATHPRFIGTVPRQGYCFLAQVQGEAIPEGETTEQEQALPSEPGLAPATTWIPAELPKRRSAPRRVWILAVTLLVIAASAFLVSRKTHVGNSPLDIVPITSYRGPQGSPTLSPDGSRVAFAWVGESGDNIDLYVQRLDGTERRRLTTDPAPEQAPTWSPSGGTIAFNRSGQLFTIPATGGQESRLTTAAGPRLSWSPDSRQIAFSDRTAEDGRLGIFLISVDSGERRRLTTPVKASENDIHPAFSPDGQWVAFVRTDVLLASIYRIPVSGGNPVQVARPSMPSAGLVWSPDGRFLLFATGPLAPGLLFVPAGASNATHLERLDVAGFNVFDPSVNGRNGSRQLNLTYAQKSTNWDIFGASIGSRASAPAPLAASNRPDGAPSFSPDGKQMAYSSSQTGYEEIWVSMADGSQPRQLTHFKSAITNSPRWSPDGRWIAFHTSADGNLNIFRVSSEGGAPVRVTDETSAEVEPNWSHDGQWLYFMSDRSGSKQVWKAPVEGGRAVQITQQGGFQAFESDDGRYVYYAKQQRGPGVWRVPVNGGAEAPFSDRPCDNYWTLAGGGLYYVDVAERLPQLLTISGSVSIRRIDLATNRTTTVATIEASFPAGVRALDVTRDGQHLAWVSWRERTTELMMIRNLRIAP